MSEQRLRIYDERTIRVETGEIVFIPRGVYYVIIREFKARVGESPKQYMLRLHRNRLS